MLATVFTKTVRDRWIGVTVGTAVVALFLLYGMSVYRQIDLSLYAELPEALRSLFGIPADTDAGGLAYGAIYAFTGAMTLAGLAISMGSGSIAGEEREGTLGLLLASPKSRTHVLISKAGAIVLLTGAAGAALWGVAIVVPRLLGVDVSGLRPGALLVHIFACTVFFGCLALMVGAWTGSGRAASATSVTVLVVSYFAVGLLPLIGSLENGVYLFPWYYLDGGQPVLNGVRWGHVAVLLGASLVFAVLAVVGVNRRDLKEQSASVTVIDRLRANPLTTKVIERLAGSARVSRIWIKTASDHQGLVTVAGLLVLSMGIMIGPFFLLIDDALRDFAEQLPEVLLAMVGYADMGTPEGWYQTENYSFTLPAAMIAVTGVIGARALAGEEARRTMGLLLANPVSRTRVIAEKTTAMVFHAAVVGLLAFLGTAAGSLLGGLGMNMVHIAGTSVLLTLLGLVFGGLALALSAATGRVKVAAFGTAGLVLALFLVNSLLPLTESVAGYAKWSPFYYYVTGNPLATGMQWSHAAVLGALFAALFALSVFLFRRRDLRQVG